MQSPPVTFIRVLWLPMVIVLSLALGPFGAAAALGASEDPVGEWPLQPVPQVVTGFDPPADPWGAGHRGVDLMGTPGQRVRAALPGRITFAGRLAGRGVVVVDHGPTRTTYEPVTASRAVGDQVGAGEVIGSLELVGSHCFPQACLHWGWLRGETYLDPLDLVGAGPVRLLPLWRTEPVPAGPQPLIRSAYAGWSPLATIATPSKVSIGW